MRIPNWIRRRLTVLTGRWQGEAIEWQSSMTLLQRKGAYRYDGGRWERL